MKPRPLHRATIFSMVFSVFFILIAPYYQDRSVSVAEKENRPEAAMGALPPAARRGLAPSVPSLAPAAGLLLPVVAFINFTLYHLLYALSRQKYTGGGEKRGDTGNCQKNMVCWPVKICFEENP